MQEPRSITKQIIKPHQNMRPRQQFADLVFGAAVTSFILMAAFYVFLGPGIVSYSFAGLTGICMLVCGLTDPS